MKSIVGFLGAIFTLVILMRSIEAGHINLSGIVTVAWRTTTELFTGSGAPQQPVYPVPSAPEQ